MQQKAEQLISPIIMLTGKVVGLENRPNPYMSFAMGKGMTRFKYSPRPGKGYIFHQPFKLDVYLCFHSTVASRSVQCMLLLGLALREKEHAHPCHPSFPFFIDGMWLWAILYNVNQGKLKDG